MLLVVATGSGKGQSVSYKQGIKRVGAEATTLGYEHRQTQIVFLDPLLDVGIVVGVQERHGVRLIGAIQVYGYDIRVPVLVSKHKRQSSVVPVGGRFNFHGTAPKCEFLHNKLNVR